jgi:hypothetical protein
MRIVVLFNLRPGVTPEAYEAWAVANDLPTVRGLGSVAGFRVHALTGLLFGEGKPPYQYIEVIDVADMAKFGADVASPAVQAGAARFQELADAPLFLTTREVGA